MYAYKYATTMDIYIYLIIYIIYIFMFHMSNLDNYYYLLNLIPNYRKNVFIRTPMHWKILVSLRFTLNILSTYDSYFRHSAEVQALQKCTENQRPEDERVRPSLM